MNVVLESDNIKYVNVCEELIEDYLIILRDRENVNRYLSGAFKDYTYEQEVKWVNEKLENKEYVYSMIEKKSNKFIGNIELMDRDEKEGNSLELGIAITANMQNKGYGKEAIRRITKYAKEDLKIEKVHLRVHPENARAIHVYLECGFVETKRDEKHIYMDLV